MKIAVATAVSLLIVSLHVISGPGTPGENTYVRFSATLKHGSQAGRPAGALLFNLRPRKGIHVNLDPPISVTFDSTAPAKAAGKLEVPRMEKLPYLDTSKAIIQRFTLRRQSKPAPVTLKGVLTYFYCSDAEGWCSKFKQPFAVTVPVTQ